MPAAAPAGTGRFARDPAEYATATGVRLQVVDGAAPTASALTCPRPQVPQDGGRARLIISSPLF